MLTPAELAVLFPLLYKWAEDQEQFILQNGMMLDDDQIMDAVDAGVRHPDRVRLLKVIKIPGPTNPELLQAIRNSGLISASTIGLTLRYGIFIRADYWGNRKLTVHELAHTMQYERFGSLEAFLQQYLHECFTYGYPLAPLELEAVKVQKEVCR